MIDCRKKQGFTLMELLIVIGIIGILVAISIPVFTNLLTKAKETVAISNCSQAVRSADLILLDEMASGTLTNSKILNSSENKDKILSAGGLAGQIVDTTVDLDTAAVTYLQFIDSNSLIVIFDPNHDPSYYIVQYASGTAPAYTYAANALLQASNLLQNVSGRDKQTQKLQQLFLQERGGTYPLLSSEEQRILTSKNLASATASSLNWRPILSSTGELFLVASDSPATRSNPFGYMIYYNNHYFYWYHFGAVKSQYVSDQYFDVTVLNPAVTSPPSKEGIWVCFSGS